MHEPELSTDSPLFCSRCGTPLSPGRGNFYLVKIEAVADPSPPEISPEELAGDLADEIRGLLDQMRGDSPRELMDQVYRRLTLHLCGRCYPNWIENPAG